MLIPKKTKVARARTKVGAYFERTSKLYGPDWPQRRLRVARSQSYRCFRCGKALKSTAYPDGVAWECHHRQSLGAGGSNGDNNLCAICRDCHKLEHAHMRR